MFGSFGRIGLIAISGIFGSFALTESSWAQAVAAPAPLPSAHTAAVIAAEAFYGLPDIADTALSPSGRWLAVSVGKPGPRVGLMVLDVHD